MTSKSRNENKYFIGSMHGTCIVWGEAAIKPAIDMLCQVYGDKPTDYEVTKIDRVDFSLHSDDAGNEIESRELNCKLAELW
ncbi:hypothetical protein [Xanthomonas phage JGB6]|nr:hypothetical protein [Xanthomonas phage JGB6]